MADPYANYGYGAPAGPPAMPQHVQVPSGFGGVGQIGDFQEAYALTPAGIEVPQTTARQDAWSKAYTYRVQGRKSTTNKIMRTAGGRVWEDNTLEEWPENDYRIFVGDLGNEVTDEVLSEAFRQYSSFHRAKVVRNGKTNKSRGYGFVSLMDPMDFLKALKEMNGKYIGNRPCKLRKSQWKKKNLKDRKKKDAKYMYSLIEQRKASDRRKQSLKATAGSKGLGTLTYNEEAYKKDLKKQKERKRREYRDKRGRY